MKSLIVVVLMTLVASVGAVAKEAQPVMGDEVLQERVMKLSGELRCLVCQGESLADSHSDFASDMRNKIKGLVVQGKTDQEIKDYLVERYGDFILYRTPFKAETSWIWLGPVVLLVVGAGLLFYNLRRRQVVVTAAPPLSAQEQAQVKNLLKEDTGDSKA